MKNALRIGGLASERCQTSVTPRSRMQRTVTVRAQVGFSSDLIGVLLGEGLDMQRGFCRLARERIYEEAYKRGSPSPRYSTPISTVCQGNLLYIKRLHRRTAPPGGSGHALLPQTVGGRRRPCCSRALGLGPWPDGPARDSVALPSKPAASSLRSGSRSPLDGTCPAFRPTLT